MSTQDNEPTEEAVLAAYQAVNQHWSHAEQERWSILYNFLTANAVLLVAWAAIYSSQNHTKTLILVVLSLGGVAISFLWLTIGSRVNSFIKRYGQLGEMVEKKLHLHALGSFHSGETIRSDEHLESGKGRGKRPLLERLGAFIPSRVFVLLIPTLFALIYFILFVLSMPIFLDP